MPPIGYFYRVMKANVHDMDNAGDETMLLAEQAPEAMTDRLLRANLFKDKLLAIIGHDLKSPLNNIQSVISSLQEEYISDAERPRLMTLLMESVDCTLQMLDNLLAWAARNYSCDLQEADTLRETFNIHALVNTAIETVRILAARKGIMLINNVSIGLAVFADRQQMLFVLRNVIHNAIKFSYPNQRVFISARRNGAKVEISVTDFGAGIPARHQEVLFQMGTRATQTGTQNEKGGGLGLILCKDFVDHNGGSIRIESQEGEGTRVIITLEAPAAHPSYGRRVRQAAN